MPLMSCPDCGKDVSDLAPGCPHCGRPLEGARPARWARQERDLFRLRLAVFSVVVVLMGGIFAMAQWSAYQTRQYAVQSTENVRRLVRGCLDAEFQPENPNLATVVCHDLARTFVVLRGQVREITDIYERQAVEEFP
ncbi:MAG: zinc ribbon domain-containing protein [Candidatus Adiutrix sp.]|nr:zinc ribbon domain-containing protein [Candidatus Adiutrix sp.]